MNILTFQHRPSIRAGAACAGPKEGEGPLGRCFDRVYPDDRLGEETWELAESHMQRDALGLALEKTALPQGELDCILGGDLVNQCTATSFAVNGTHLPFLGLYSACATFSEAMLLAGVLTDGGYCQTAAAVTSSHFSTAERQFRFPLAYGGQRTPTAQWTSTAAGAALVSAANGPVYLAGGCIGRICDLEVTDSTNMGAAMAPAAADTILRYLGSTNTAPADYNAIITGDLGQIGTALLHELLARDGISIGAQHLDCGGMMFDNNAQDTHAGGSGAGCSSSVFCGHFLPKLQSGEHRRVLLCATGALLSAMSAQQGQTIPGICHLIEIRSDAA